MEPSAEETRILQFVVDFKRRNDGCSPSLREIAEGCGICSTSVVRYHLDKLEAAGQLRFSGSGLSRNIEVGGEWRPPASSYSQNVAAGRRLVDQ